MSKQMIAAALVLAVARLTQAEEVDTPIQNLPQGVQKAIRTTVGAGTISKTVKETEKDGTVLYEVAYTVGKTKFEAEVSPQGKLLVVDEQIELGQAPKPVQKTISKHTAGAQIKKIEKATKGNELFYETEFLKDGKEHEIKVAPDGKVIALE
jgi:uncharacterized membrane protein YkoI